MLNFKPNYNWLPDKIDTRDHIYRYTPLEKMPSLVDLRPWCSPIETQGNLGSCTGNAIAGQIELINRKNNKIFDVSRLFIYYQTRLLENTINSDEGAYIRNGLKAVNRFGAPLEELWPYVESNFNVRPSAEAYDDGAKRKVISYAKCMDFESIKNSLVNGYPVTIGYYIYSSFESNKTSETGIMSFPDIMSEENLGGHAVCLVGYDDNFRNSGQGYFIARNSWGAEWGDQGYFYMPYQIIQTTTMSADFWMISAVNNP